MIILGFSGKAENGKTWTANKLKTFLESDGYACVIQPLAKKMKEQAKMLGWDGEKDERGRKLLQEISWPVKHYFGEQIYAKWCIEDAMKELAKITTDKSKWIVLIDDVRMMAEIDYLKTEKLPFKLIRVNRPGWVSKLTPEQLKDVSETQLDDYPEFDYHLENPGTLGPGSDAVYELYKKLKPIL